VLQCQVKVEKKCGKSGLQLISYHYKIIDVKEKDEFNRDSCRHGINIIGEYAPSHTTMSTNEFK
jgi:hypothetical protein